MCEVADGQFLACCDLLDYVNRLHAEGGIPLVVAVWTALVVEARNTRKDGGFVRATLVIVDG